jgi:hypothetical protein
MNFYPFTSPIILTDDIFQAYGGIAGSSTPDMRSVCYTIAEEMFTDDVGTFLLPVIVTGTQYYSNRHTPYITEYAYVNQVILVRFLDTQERIYYSISGTANVYASLRNDTYGVVDIHHIFGNCQCATSLQPFPYQFQVVYQAGLPTGTASNPKILMGLSTTADMVLRQLEGYGNEADGLVGVDQFKNQDYSEVRHNLKRTAFGSSARAQFVSGLYTSLRKHRHVRL